jgi:uncharacterized protein
MSVREKIQNDLKTAMKAQDKMTTSVLRMMLSDIKYLQAEVGVARSLTPEEELKAVAGYHKKMLKSLEQFPEGDKADEMKKEIQIVEQYLPKKLSEQEVQKVVAEVVKNSTETNFGLVMKAVMAKLGGQADGKMVSELIKNQLKNT